MHLGSKATSIRILMIRSPQNTETKVLRAARSESLGEFCSLERLEEYKTRLSGGLVCSPHHRHVCIRSCLELTP